MRIETVMLPATPRPFVLLAPIGGNNALWHAGPRRHQGGNLPPAPADGVAEMPVGRAAEGAGAVLPDEPSQGRNDAVSPRRTGGSALYGGRGIDRAPRPSAGAARVPNRRARPADVHVRGRG